VVIAGRSLHDGGAAVAAPRSPRLSPAPEGPHRRSPVGARVVPTVVLAALRSPIVTPRASALPGRGLLAARPLGSADARRRCGLSRPLAREGARDDARAQAARARRLRRQRAADAASRLTSWEQGAQVHSWNLSLVGDWRSITRDGVVEARMHTAVHEATRVGATSLSYDVKGNLTKDELGQRLLWDAENRLREAQRLSDSNPNRASYAYDALGRRVAKTVDGMRTDYVHAGAQVVQTYGLPGLVRPRERASDGANSTLALTPAGGGLLPAVAGKTTLRVNFQPTFTAIPAGYLADKGRALGVRTNGRIYGWDQDRTGDGRARGMLGDAAFDTLIPMGDGRWRMALGNGSYTVAVIAGDAAYTDSTNNLTVNGIALTDPDPGTVQPGYARGDFDGWAVQVVVTDGYLTIEAGAGAVEPKLVLVEIGPRNVTHTLPVAQATVAERVQAMTDATIVPDPDRVAAKVPKMYVYGSYVDEVVCFVTGSGAQAQRYFPHYNHLYSVAALTDAAGVVVERFQYDSYGKQKITDASGNVTRAKSAVGWDRGFTGYIADSESGLAYARSRMYSPMLGRFISRDPVSRFSLVGIRPDGISDGWASMPEKDVGPTVHSGVFPAWMNLYPPIGVPPMPGDGYLDGMSLFSAYFTPNYSDPSGMVASLDKKVKCGTVHIEWNQNQNEWPPKRHGVGIYNIVSMVFQPDGTCVCKCDQVTYTTVTAPGGGAAPPEWKGRGLIGSFDGVTWNEDPCQYTIRPDPNFKGTTTLTVTATCPPPDGVIGTVTVTVSYNTGQTMGHGAKNNWPDISVQ
jgi:RHS repeat-associated protein